MPIADDAVGTVGVDRWWRLYWSPRYAKTIGAVALGRVIAAHEVEHLLRNHFGRLSSLGNLASNLAGDLEINDDVPEGYLPSDICHPSDFGLPVGLTAEEYLAALPQTAIIRASNLCAGGSGAGVPAGWEYADPENGIDETSASAIRYGVAGDIRAYVAKHGRGSVPAHALIWANLIAPLPSPVDWRRILAATAGRVAREVTAGRQDYSWRRPARRSSAVLRPALVSPRPQIVVVADTSGSMDDYGRDVITAVTAIIRAVGDTAVIQCDTQITNVSRGMPREWRGGGGTELCVGIDRAVCMRPDAIVVVTDGITSWPNRPKIPVIAAIIGDEPAPNWVRVVRIPLNDSR